MLMIDIVEPCPARPKGDRVPCHLFMPEVAWPQSVDGEDMRLAAVMGLHGPNFMDAADDYTPRPRRELYLQRVEPWGPDLSSVGGISRSDWRILLLIAGAALGVVAAAIRARGAA